MQLRGYGFPAHTGVSTEYFLKLFTTVTPSIAFGKFDRPSSSEHHPCDSQVYRQAVTTGGCPKVADNCGHPVKPEELDAWYAAAHMEAHPQPYGAALGLPEQEVRATSGWLRASRVALARAGMRGSLEGGVLEEAFRACGRLAIREASGSEAEAYLRAVRGMWEASVEAGAGGSGGEATLPPLPPHEPSSHSAVVPLSVPISRATLGVSHVMRLAMVIGTLSPSPSQRHDSAPPWPRPLRA